MLFDRCVLWFPLAILIAAAPSFSFAQTALPLDITADSLEYLADQKLMVARGNVEIRDGDTTLTADYMSVQTETMDIHARGNVFYQSGTETWRGDEFRYNMKSKRGDFGKFSAYYDPFYLSASESRRTGPDSFELKDVSLTTCEGDDPAISVHAGEGSVVSNRIYARHAVVKVANMIPIFYMPYYTRSLDSHERFFQFLPGYNSRLGGFLLTAYNYPIAGVVRGRTHLDYRSRRGVGVGQDFLWRDREKTYEGIVQGYYLQDDDPLRGSVTEAREGVVEDERYRLRLSHVQQLSDRDTLNMQANYLSDPYVLKDFFRKEFREAVQPENRLTLSHRDDNYIAALQVNKRLNDFYENVDRVPELTLDVPRQQVYDSDFYYESKNSASYLERVYPEDSENEDYDSFRFDTGHTLYYPFRVDGFLNLIPRAGYRGTYYSTTLSRSISTNIYLVTPTNGPAYTTNEVVTTLIEEGGGFRSIPQLGWEGSFKAFRTWDDYVVLGDGDGLRHVVEPYLDHTYWLEPNLLPDELPQFDSIDTLDERHDIKLGLRNKIQTRRNEQPVDIIDLNAYTYYRVEKKDDQEDFSDFYWEGDLRFHRDVLIELDGSYDFYESELKTFNTRVLASFSDDTAFTLEHRYRVDSQSLLSAALELLPNNIWAFDAGVRYDLEESELEEHYYMVKHTGRCVSWGLGVREILDDDEDELEIWVQLWLTAFPEAIIDFDY